MAIIYGSPFSDKAQLPQGSRGYKGKKGEEKILAKLKELDDNYHVLCNLKLGFNPFGNVGRKTQIDFLVISKRGIFPIEVKNWSDDYYVKHKKYGYPSPHAQVDKAGRTLWGYLHRRISNFKNPPVHRILLSTFGNIPFDPKFQYVNVKTPDNIINFLQSRTEKLSEEKIQEIIEYLVMYVPN